jgi:hypothetical protein
MPGLSLVLALAAPLAAAALEPDEQPDYGRPGWYASAQAVFALEELEHKQGATADSDFGARGTGGYRFNRWVAFDAELEWIHGFDLSGGPLSAPKRTATTSPASSGGSTSTSTRASC